MASFCLGLAVAGAVLLYLDRAAIYSFNAAFGNLIPALTLPAVGGLIAARRTRNPIGWILLATAVFASAGALGYAAAVRGLLSGASPHGWVRWAGWAYSMGNAGFAPMPLVLLLFPDGKPLTVRWRWVVRITAVATIAFLAGTAVDTTPIEVSSRFPRLVNPIGVSAFMGFASITFLPIVIFLMVSAVALVLRFRRSRGDDRQQLKWLAYAMGLVVVFSLLGPPASALSPAAGNAMFTIGFLFGLAIAAPIAIALAILKYRLYDIDLVINRTLVYFGLAAFITAVYVAIVVGIGAAIGRGSSQPNLALSILATAVVAVAFQPVRGRVQRLANRLVYGVRATPYEVLSEFASRMGDTVATEDLLPRMARILAQGTGAARADVWLRVGEELREVAAWPPEGVQRAPVLTPEGGVSLPPIPGSDLAVPIDHRGELLGALSLTKRPGEALTPTESALAAHLAAQAGLVVHNVRLDEELRARAEELGASRSRLVSARDAERRRLERNLHDGAQSRLVSLARRIGQVRSMVGSDDDGEKALLAGLKADAQEALEGLRDLARGIYPPLLADKGLAAALEAQANRSPLEVNLEAAELGRYAQEVEATVYFCAMEALQNVAKHAGTSSVRIRLWEEEGSLSFEVSDDGVGFDPAVVGYGAGMQGMADRATSLAGGLTIRSAPGSGTTVAGWLPVSPTAVPEMAG